MERNTVLVDLDRYEEMVKERSLAVAKNMEFVELIENNYLIPKKDVRVGEDDGLYLTIKIEALENIVNTMDGYCTKRSHYDETKVGSYVLNIEKAVD